MPSASQFVRVPPRAQTLHDSGLPCPTLRLRGTRALNRLSRRRKTRPLVGQLQWRVLVVIGDLWAWFSFLLVSAARETPAFATPGLLRGGTLIAWSPAFETRCLGPQL